MTADEYLRRIRKIDVMIVNKQEDYERLTKAAEGFGSAVVGDKVQSSKNLRAIPDAIGRYIDIEREIDRLKQQRREMIGKVEQLPTIEYDVLFRRYVLMQPLKEIAYRYRRTYEWAQNIKRRGLRRLQRMLDEKVIDIE